MSGTNFKEGDRIASVSVREDAPPPQELEQERRVAIYDLIEESRLRLQAFDGPYKLSLSRIDGAEPGYRFEFRSENGSENDAVDVRRKELEEAAREYIELCAAYREAVRRLPPGQIEAADAERRALHGEAAELLSDALAPSAEMDETTRRRLFTLCCTLDAGMEKLL